MKLIKIVLIVTTLILSNSIKVNVNKNTVESGNKSKVENKKSEVSVKSENKEKNLGKSQKAEKKADPSQQNLINNAVGKTTTFDANTEAETVEDPHSVDIPTLQENPPKTLSNKKDIPNLEGHVNPADKANTQVTGLDVSAKPPKRIDLEPVTYVKELSEAGKAALDLQESGDVEYQKLLNAGFETPKTISNIIDDKPTPVARAANTQYMWQPTEPRNNNLYQNVEFNRYNNRLMDTHRYQTPARFEKNMFGNVIVHAPSGSDMQITTPSKLTLSTFLSQDENENLVDDDAIMESINDQE